MENLAIPSSYTESMKYTDHRYTQFGFSQVENRLRGKKNFSD